MSSEPSLDAQVVSTIAARPQFRSSIERMHAAIAPLNDPHVNRAFSKYLEKIAASDESAGARFVAEMERFALAAQQMNDTIERSKSATIDPGSMLMDTLPWGRAVLRGIIAAIVITAAFVVFALVRSGAPS